MTPDDVKALAVPVLAHRLILRAEYELEGLTVVEVIEGTVTTSAENTAASEEINATVIQIISRIKSLVKLESDLSNLTNVLKGSILQFNISEDLEKS